MPSFSEIMIESAEEELPRAADDTETTAIPCYKAGAEYLHLKLAMCALEYFDYERLNSALAQLRELKPHLKQQLLEACAAVALADGQMHSDQHALLHGIAATLDCPLPLIAQSD